MHGEAASALADTAEKLAGARWLTPRAEGKWTPAEIVEHLNLSYETLLRELAGGKGMQVRTKLWQRLLLRFTLMPKLLRGGKFPLARAPRETRPAAANPDPVSAIAAFRERSLRLDALAAEVVASGRRRKLTHAYFGSASVPKAVLLCARHVQHHQKQLAELRS
ncbi:MAG TPA: DinB family protein [Thermoanaerobaculia bacterium]|nr:DinB family protein [Thermoanaerobaculia bacterium]